MRRLIPLLLLAACGPLAAGDFGDLVRGIEKHFGVRHTGIPLLGLATFGFKVARPGGVGDLKLAVFENSPMYARQGEFQGVAATALGAEWRPFIRVAGRCEAATIYAKVTGNQLRMTIASMEPDETVVLQIRVDGDRLWRWFDDPEGEARRSLSDAQ